MMMKRRDLLFTRMAYATSAQKKPTMTDKSSSSSKDNKEASSAAASGKVDSAPVASTESGSSGSSSNCNNNNIMNSSGSNSNNSISKANLRLVDYLSRKDLEMQRRVVMDMVTKSEVKFYDPPYLARDAPFPVYAELNINLKGYDFTVLESYHNFIARLCRSLEVDVKDVYAMPARSLKVSPLKNFYILLVTFVCNN